MDLSRLGRGEMIAGISGVALIIIMFLSWWGAPDTINGIPIGEIPGADATANAWQMHSFNDIVWFVTALAAVGLALLAATQTRVELPVAASAIVTALGVLSLVLIVIRLIDPPNLNGGIDAGREFGVWLGLIAILGITYGGWTAMQEEGTSFGEQARGVQERVGARDDEPPSDEPPSPPPPPPPPSQPPTGGGPNP